MADQTTDLTFLSQFHFLQTIPYVEALEQSDDTDCFICKEPYDMRNRKWRFGASHNYPVRLPCRHVLGIQCLARWIFSPDFSNRCCLCRAIVLHTQDEETILSDMRNIRVMECLRTMMAGGGKREAIKEIRTIQIRRLTERITRIGPDRAMIPYEVFVDQFEPQPSREKVLENLWWGLNLLEHVMWGLIAVFMLCLAILSVRDIVLIHFGILAVNPTLKPISHWIPWITLGYSIIVTVFITIRYG